MNLKAIPFIQSFYSTKDLSHPLEYDINPVDEIINVYDIETDYNSFINESLKILNKYQTECNPNNKKLVFVTDKCDKEFKNNYTHGGYECGDNGKWSTKCIPSYCDIGYIFDHDKKNVLQIFVQVLNQFQMILKKKKKKKII